MNKSHVVIVGGGLSGLSTAFFIFRRSAQEHLPLKITVLEASNRFGGVLRTLAHEGLRMEAGADAFYAGQKDATDLCRELGLQEDMVEAAPCFRRGRWRGCATPCASFPSRSTRARSCRSPVGS